MVKFAKAPAAKYFAGRIDTISEKLADAENARVDAETERDRVKAALADSEAEKARIITEAQDSAVQIRERSRPVQLRTLTRFASGVQPISQQHVPRPSPISQASSPDCPMGQRSVS